MVKKIAIIGTHSAGKTTLSYYLAYRYKIDKHSVKIIQEVARSCPYELNEKMGKETCLWIYHEHIRKELEAMRKFDTIICDRSCIDSFIYADVQECFDFSDAGMVDSFHSAKEWMKTYDKIIYVATKGKALPEEDGVRSTDIRFQRNVEKKFEEFVDHFSVLRTISIVTSDIIFDEQKIKEIYTCLSGSAQ